MYQPGELAPLRTASRILRDLLERLEEDGLNHRQIAELAGVHRVSISNWRSGKYTPDLLTIEALAQATGYRLVLTKELPPDPGSWYNAHIRPKE